MPVVAVARAPAWPAVLSPGRAQWRLLCVLAQAGGGGGGGGAGACSRRRARANLYWLVTHRCWGDPRCTNGDSGFPRVSALNARDSRIRVLETWRHWCMCVWVCERARERACAVECGPGMWEGASQGAACTRGNGGGLLCVVLGGAAAH